MRSLLQTSIFTAFQRFDYRDGTLGLGLQRKSGKASNGPQIVRKRTLGRKHEGILEARPSPGWWLAARVESGYTSREY